MIDDKNKHPDENPFEPDPGPAEERVEEETVEEIEIERPEPYPSTSEPSGFEDEDDADAIPAELVEPLRDDYEDAPAAVDRPPTPMRDPLVDAAPAPPAARDHLAPLDEELTTAETIVLTAEAMQRRRDGDTMMMLGGFVAILAVPVLIGSAFAGREHAMYVNIAAGVVLLAIGVGMLLRGRFVRRS